MSLENELKEFKEIIDRSEYDISINGKGTKAEIKGGSNSMGEIIAITLLVTNFDERRKITPETFMGLVSKFLKMGRMITAESQEELDVMEAILRNGGRFDGKDF